MRLQVLRVPSNQKQIVKSEINQKKSYYSQKIILFLLTLCFIWFNHYGNRIFQSFEDSLFPNDRYLSPCSFEISLRSLMCYIF